MFFYRVSIVRIASSYILSLSLSLSLSGQLLLIIFDSSLVSIVNINPIAITIYASL